MCVHVCVCVGGGGAGTHMHRPVEVTGQTQMSTIKGWPPDFEDNLFHLSGTLQEVWLARQPVHTSQSWDFKCTVVYLVFCFLK